MRRFVFPRHKKIVETAHRHGKPCILHSCQDNIVPIEEAYEQLNGRIAVLGGIDMIFLVTGTPDEVYRRSRAMLEFDAR